ncbi:uncharacterized protein ACR2FA_010890 [Aphomia sociella]
MVAKTFFVICANLVLIQSALGQINYAGWSPAAASSISGNNIVENTVVIGNNAGAGSIGLANSGSLGSSVGLANTGVVGSGFANAGLLNAGISGIGLANSGLVLPATNAEFLSLASLSSGGVLPITSYSPIVPSGLTVYSENAIEGPVAVIGQLPFLSAVAFEGTLASEGAGSAGCGCGSSGNIGIVSETYTPIAAPAPSGLGLGAGLGFGAGLGRGWAL